MTLEAVLAALHILAILTFVVCLSSQAARCRIEWLNAAVVERLVRLDVIYNVTALVLLLTGLARVVWVEYGWWQPGTAGAADGYDARSEDGANYSRLVSDRRVDSVAGSQPLRSGLCEIEPLSSSG